MANTFTDFADKRKRKSIKELKTLMEIFKVNGFVVKDYLEENDPYIYIYARTKDLSFDGVRVYKIGNAISYRTQKKENTHPYGRAYLLDVTGMYDDLISDHKKEIAAGKIVIETIVNEINKFFDTSVDAEKLLRHDNIEKFKDPLSRAVVNVSGSDYGDMIK